MNEAFKDLLPPRGAGQRALAANGVQVSKSATFPYGVLVTLRMRRQDMHRFFRLAQSLKGDYLMGGLKLQMSAWDVRTEDPRAQAPVDRRAPNRLQPREVEMFNLWHLKDHDADSLRKAMEYLYDVVDYYSLGDLELSEDKVLGVRLTKPSAPPILTAGTRYVYVRVTHYILASRLAKFRASLRANMAAFREATGWLGGDAYLGITGSPNIVTQVWVVPEGSYARFNSLLARAPWDPLVETAPIYDVMQASPFDPLLGEP